MGVREKYGRALCMGRRWGRARKGWWTEGRMLAGKRKGGGGWEGGKVERERERGTKEEEEEEEEEEERERNRDCVAKGWQGRGARGRRHEADTDDRLVVRCSLLSDLRRELQGGGSRSSVGEKLLCYGRSGTGSGDPRTLRPSIKGKQPPRV
ncbi:hypothetical protein KM043_005234 [Ampulex compressa]|nr:hypothetical protein KM043_005234 [Ampulex compressa]